MNNVVTAVIGVILLGAVVGCFYWNQPQQNSTVTSLKSDKDRISYSIGYQFGRPLQQVEKEEISFPALQRGLEDSVNKAEKPLLSEQEMQMILQKFGAELQQKAKEKAEAVAKEALERAEKYLKANSEKPGVVKTESGLQYVVLTPGTGTPPSEEDTVVVEYSGKLMDGKFFAEPNKDGKPAEFRVSQVIPGWKEALRLMTPGAHWQVTIPPELGYGARGVPKVIGPNEPLIMEIKLLSIKPPEPEEVPPPEQQ